VVAAYACDERVDVIHVGVIAANGDAVAAGSCHAFCCVLNGLRTVDR
jgi:hypothetical protein